MSNKNRIYSIATTLILFLLCLVPTSSLGKKRIIWDKTSIKKIDRNIDYCRLKCLSNGNIAVVYRHLLGCKFKVYDGNGKCIIDTLVFKNQYLYNKHKSLKAYVLMANPELLELKNGRLLYVCNYRPLEGQKYPFSIASVYSDDGGKSWSKPNVIYQADTLYNNGCWEPSLIQLPDGTVQVYFANENNFRNSNEQEIDMMESRNNGRTWRTKLVRVSFSKGKRDGMPVPKLYGDSIYVVIEDNTLGKHKPSIVVSSIADNWNSYVDSYSKKRTNIMQTDFPTNIYGGAPYLAIDSEGTQYISCQSNYKRSGGIDNTNLLVIIKDNGQIVDISYPFDMPLNKYGRWGAIELKDDSTIIATVSSNINGECAPYIIKGKIVDNEK